MTKRGKQYKTRKARRASPRTKALQLAIAQNERMNRRVEEERARKGKEKAA